MKLFVNSRVSLINTKDKQNANIKLYSGLLGVETCTSHFMLPSAAMATIWAQLTFSFDNFGVSDAIDLISVRGCKLDPHNSIKIRENP